MKKSNLKKINLLILITIIIVSTGLPLSIIFEFNNSYIFYFKLYPHMILFPLFCFGIIGINLYQAFLTIRRQQRFIHSKVFIISISFVISLLFYYIEITSNNIMLFELSDRAIANIEVSKEAIEEIHAIPKNIIDSNIIVSENSINISKLELENAIRNFIENQEILNINQKKNYYSLMRVSLSYSTWKNKTNDFSFSRKLYAISFFIMVFTSLMNWILLFTYSYRDVINPKKYINSLVMSSLLFFTWLPLRLYYNLTTKNIIFGSEEAIGQLDVFAFLIYPLYFSFLCWKFLQLKNDRFIVGLIIAIIVSLTLIGRLKPEWVGLIFGLNSNPIFWIIILGIAIVYCFQQVKRIKMFS